MDFGIKGIHFSTDSLATVAKGGVAFITPKTRNPGDQQPVETGHVFELYEKADKDWLNDAVAIELLPTAEQGSFSNKTPTLDKH